jgi:orc1/cdc6 family replication initiation protein
MIQTGGNDVITDARVLRGEFIPREVVHRDAETQQLANNLEPLIDDGAAQNTLITGPPGAGKTAITRHTLDRLQEEALDVQYQYINCWENYNRFKVLYKALEGIGKTLDIHRRSTPTDELYSRLQEYDKRPYVLILDEVDQVEDTKVLYDLYAMQNVALIMIANREEDVFAGMDDRVRSRLINSARIGFKPYRHAELTDIVADRAEWGMRPDSIERTELEQIAHAADGDARIGIGILRNAARLAEDQDADRITGDIITEAIPDARQETRQKNVDKLNEHQQALYDIIEDAGTIQPRELYDRYEDAADDPRSERMLRKYLNKMEHYNLVESSGEGRWREYSIHEAG